MFPTVARVIPTVAPDRDVPTSRRARPRVVRFLPGRARAARAARARVPIDVAARRADDATTSGSHRATIEIARFDWRARSRDREIARSRVSIGARDLAIAVVLFTLFAHTVKRSSPARARRGALRSGARRRPRGGGEARRGGGVALDSVVTAATTRARDGDGGRAIDVFTTRGASGGCLAGRRGRRRRVA